MPPTVDSPPSPASAAIAHSASVPIKNDTNAAWKVPICLPSSELIGACRAIRPPVMAVMMTAVPRSMPGVLLGFEPVRPDARVDGQRRVEVGGAHHLAADDLASRVHLRDRALEQQLVVDLEDQPRRQ